METSGNLSPPSGGAKKLNLNPNVHKNSTLIFFVILTIFIIAILILIAILFVKFYQLQKALTLNDIQIIPGTWQPFRENVLCQALGLNCQTNNASSVYGRCLFPQLGDSLTLVGYSENQINKVVGAHTFNFNQAMVALVPVPFDRVYWACTGYCRTKQVLQGNDIKTLAVNASTADSVDTGDFLNSSSSTSQTKYVCVIFTANPNLVPDIMQACQDRISAFNNLNVLYKTIFIPSSMYAVDSTYALWTRQVLTPENGTLPQWKCWYFNFKEGIVPAPVSPVISFVQPRNTNPNESLVLNTSFNDWYNEANTYMTTTFPTMIDSSWAGAGGTIPYYSWDPNFCFDSETGQQCGLLCGCNGYQNNVNLRFDNNSTIYYICGYGARNHPTEYGIAVPPNYMLVAYCLNHVWSHGVVAYSNINFSEFETEISFGVCITGMHDPYSNNPEYKNIPSEPTKKITYVYQKIPSTLRQESKENGIVHVIVTERAYVNANGTGPWYSSILPCQIFLVPENAQLPSYFITGNSSVNNGYLTE